MNKKEKTLDLLIEHVTYQIQKDFQDGDVQALDELLKTIPLKLLIAYLPDELSSKYEYLLNDLKTDLSINQQL